MPNVPNRFFMCPKCGRQDPSLFLKRDRRELICPTCGWMSVFVEFNCPVHCCLPEYIEKCEHGGSATEVLCNR